MEHKYPKIGEPLPGAFDALKSLLKNGHKLILWTCREDHGHLIDKQYLTAAVDFCKENGIEFDAINEGIAEDDFRPEGVKRRKPYAHYYVDDAIVGGFPGWDKVMDYFESVAQC